MLIIKRQEKEPSLTYPNDFGSSNSTIIPESWRGNFKKEL
jgi:hypothetical protein